MYRVLAFLFVVLSCTLIPVAKADAQTTALTQFHTDLIVGGAWTHQHYWGSVTQPVCSWYNVTCNANGDVTSIILADNKLEGTLPGYLFQSLPYLQTLILGGPSRLNVIFGTLADIVDG
jgi:hypothetical protein